MVQKTTTDLEIINQIIDEILRLYFLGNSLKDILQYLENSMGKELFEEFKLNLCEVANE